LCCMCLGWLPHTRKDHQSSKDDAREHA